MKKLLFLMLTVLCLASCNSCTQEAAVQEQPAVAEVVEQSPVLDVDHIIAMDRQAMYLKFGEDYRWFETEILLPEFLDSEDVTSAPAMLVNIFQSVVESGNGADTYVWKFQHFADGTVNTDSIHGFWIEDFALNEEVIKLSYTEAYDRMMQTNFPKPHSKYVTLRNPIGPVAVNTQWIFGNVHEQIWVDAVTGDTASSNPAYPEEKGFKMPLGEWP